jgi:GH35 family endo-1,4-beta-xylanase
MAGAANSLGRQTRRHFLRSFLAGCGAATLPGLWPRLALADEDDYTLMQGADSRIERHRKTNGILCLKDPRGRPVAGARVALDQVRHQFLFGCNGFGLNGNRSLLQDQYEARFEALFNYATLGFYWRSCEKVRGITDYSWAEAGLDWCQPRGICCKGHTLAWDYTAPDWIPANLTEAERLSRARVAEVVARFKGRVDTWDVVNEPTHLGNEDFCWITNRPLGNLGCIDGPKSYTASYLEAARAANPEATLLVNDYYTDIAFYLILDSLREKGRLLFDTVGLQTHMHEGMLPLSDLWEMCERFAPLGVPIHFTEMTVLSGPHIGPGEKWAATTPEMEEYQALHVERIYRLLFSHPAVEAISWWDLSDLGAWKAAPAGLLRSDMSPKPVYERLHQLIKKDWWTNACGLTDTQGKFKTRTFLGTYRLSVELPNGLKSSTLVEWRRPSLLVPSAGPGRTKSETATASIPLPSLDLHLDVATA